MKWEEMFSGKTFISDLGEEQLVENEGKGGTILERYAAWAPMPGGKSHQIVEISGSLPMITTTFYGAVTRVESAESRSSYPKDYLLCR